MIVFKLALPRIISFLFWVAVAAIVWSAVAHGEIVVKSLPPDPGAARTMEREILGTTTNLDGTETLIATACGSIITVTMTREELMDPASMPEIKAKFAAAVNKACQGIWAQGK